MILSGDLLGAKRLLDRDRIAGAAFYGSIIDANHALNPGYRSDAVDDGSAGRLVAVHIIGGKGRELKECRTWIQQELKALARQKLPSGEVSLPGTLTPTLAYFGLPSVKLFESYAHGLIVLLKLGALLVYAGSEY